MIWWVWIGPVFVSLPGLSSLSVRIAYFTILCLTLVATGCMAGGGTQAQRSAAFTTNGILMAVGGGMLLYAAADTSGDCDGASECLGEEVGEFTGDLLIVGAGLALTLIGTVGLMATAASATATTEQSQAQLVPVNAPEPTTAAGTEPAKPAPVATEGAASWRMSGRRHCVPVTIPANPRTGEPAREVLYCPRQRR